MIKIVIILSYLMRT